MNVICVLNVMVDIADINTLFQMIDSDENGYIDKEKLQQLCPHLSPREIDTIFHHFDDDHDNRICLKQLLQSNKQTPIDYQLNTQENMTQTQIKEVFNNLACQEQIFDFYETLRNGSNDSIDQFQAILEVFVADILKHRKEIKRLEDSYKREKETNEKFLQNLEEDQERDMRHLEESIRQEERQRFDLERELILQRTSKEINDLQANLQRLRTIEKVYTERKSEEDCSTVLLHDEIAKLTEENRTLTISLNDSLTANAILQSDLQSFKSQLNERQTMLLHEKQSSSSNHRERESLQTNVRHLVEVNKQLRDENDSLRAIIEANQSNPIMAYHANLSSPKRLTSTTGSTLGSYWNNSKLDKSSPSYLTQKQRTFDSFDLGSADELGMPGNRAQSIENVNITVPPIKISPLAKPSTQSDLADRKNTTNDSGLSLTTARDATEIDSDHETKVNNEISTDNVKQLRPLLTKKDKDDTDSDEVFVEIPLVRTHPKRSSQRRTIKRDGQSPKIPQEVTSTTSKIQKDLPFDRMFKVVFCGDAAVGKSTLIMRLCKDQFLPSVTATLGVDFHNKQIEVDDKRIALQLWDTAGQERFRSVARSYFRRCDGVILVYDATYERSFLNVREWINTITDSTPKKVSVMIVANKIDLRDQMRAEGKRVIEHAEGVKLAKEHKALFIETSAKDGTNASETLIELARDMQCNEDLERFRTTAIDLDKKSAKKSTCCGS